MKYIVLQTKRGLVTRSFGDPSPQGEKIIGIRTRIDDSLIRQCGLSSPTHGDDHDGPIIEASYRVPCPGASFPKIDNSAALADEKAVSS